jgi:hypothetical protein
MRRGALALAGLLLGALPVAGQSLPAEVCATLRAERGRYGPRPSPAELTNILNATAWVHRADGWGLSRKLTGERCPGLPGHDGDVACDVLHHRPSAQIWDVLVAAGEAAMPSCDGYLGVQTDISRPWVAPVEPVGAIPSPPPGPDPVAAELAQLRAEIERLRPLLEAARNEAMDAAARALALQGQVDALARDLQATRTSLEEHREAVRRASTWAKRWLLDRLLPALGGVLAGWLAR